MVRSLNSTNVATSPKSSLVIAVGITIALLYFGRLIFIPIALSFVLSFLLTPLVSWLQKLRIGRAPAVLIVMGFCLATTVVVGWGVASQLLEITGHLSEYRVNVAEKVQSLPWRHNAPIIRATATVQELNKQLSDAQVEAAKNSRNKDGSTHPPHPIPVQVATPPSNFFQDLRALLGPLASSIETTALVIIFMTFMLINWEDLRNRLIRLGGQDQLFVITQAMEDAGQGLSRYLLLQFLVNTGYGCLFGIGLYLFGIPHALLWGALSASLRFVPYIGTWIAAAFPIVMAVAVFPGWKQAVLAFALFAVLEIITANAIEPWLYGAHSGISPLAILIAAVFWATLWGPVGLILSVPLTLILVLVGRYVPQMNFLEVLLGDAPALSPQEVFYQRLLAMDQDEARNIAESYLQGKSLQSLYECVLIPALRLAEEDRHTDVLGDRSSEFISQSTRELIDDLGERDTTGPEAAGIERSSSENHTSDSSLTQASVVCLPARDQADELVGMMLAQLLQKAGVKNARWLQIDTVENMLDQVEQGHFTIACVSALPPFAVGQARSLCKRLHQRFPDLSVIVGLWGFAGGVLKAQQRVGPTCTDSVCTSLSEAIFQVQKLGHSETQTETGSQDGSPVQKESRALAS